MDVHEDENDIVRWSMYLMKEQGTDCIALGESRQSVGREGEIGMMII